MLWVLTFIAGTSLTALLWLQHHCDVKLEQGTLDLRDIEKDLWL